MAESVLALAANPPVPERGRAQAVVHDLRSRDIALTVMLVISFARIPARHQRFAQRGIASRSGLVWRSALAPLSHFAWPIIGPVLALKVPSWKVFVMYQSDLEYWLEATATVVFLKRLLEITRAWHVFRYTYPATEP